MAPNRLGEDPEEEAEMLDSPSFRMAKMVRNRVAGPKQNKWSQMRKRIRGGKAEQSRVISLEQNDQEENRRRMISRREREKRERSDL